MLVTDDNQVDFTSNPVLKFMRKRFRATEELRGNAFLFRNRIPRPASWWPGLTFGILALGVIYSLWRSRSEPMQ